MQLGALEYLISVNNKGVQKGIDQSENIIKKSAGKTERLLEGYGNKLSAWTVAKGQMIARYAERAISTVNNLAKQTVKESVKAYGAYEQLEGGIKKLFGAETQKTVIANAKKAFATAGMSANDYMQTVTEFSASLISSLGGDTAKAAEVSDMAIQDMADNVNTFGSSMESVQNAYRGFSKQNYTMLDNLKLGYGGTRKEMERLLKDAEKIQKQQGKNTKYSINNLNDVYEAIHVIQESMNITGTTQKEASGTIEGSIASAKAAWQNVMTEMGKGDWTFKYYVKSFTNVAKDVIKNVKPIAQNAVKGIFILAKELLPEIGSFLKDMLKTAKVSLAELLEIKDPKDATWFDIGKALFEKIKNGVSSMVQKGENLITKWLGLKEDATWIEIGTGLFNRIKEGAESLVDGGKNLITTWLGIAADSSWTEIGKALFNNVRDGVKGSLEKGKNILTTWLNLESDVSWLKIGKALFERVKDGVTGMAGQAKNVLTAWLGIEADASWSDIGKSLFENIRDKVKELAGAGKNLLTDWLNLESDAGWLKIGSTLFKRIKDGVTGMAGQAKNILTEWLGISADNSWGTIGVELFNKIKKGVQIKVGAVKNTLTDWLHLEEDESWSGIGKSLADKIKKGFGDGKAKLAELFGLDGDSSWSDIGKKIAEGISSSIKKGKGLIMSLVLGDEYVEGESKWSDVGEKISGWISDGFKEGGFLDNLVTGFVEHLGEKWGAISDIVASVIEGVATWLKDTNHVESLIVGITTIITTLLKSASTIIEPLAGALITILTDDRIISALGNLAGSLINIAIDVLKSGDLLNALEVLLDNVIRAVFGDNIVNMLAGGKKSLVTEIDKNGNRTTRVKQEGEENKSEFDKYIENIGESILHFFGGGNIGDVASAVFPSISKVLEDTKEQVEWLFGDMHGNLTINIEPNYTGPMEQFKPFIDGAWHTKSFDGRTNPGKYATMLVNQSQGTTVSGGATYAKGDWNVAYDQYALLHRGETVMTASQARRYRDGNSMDTSAIVNAIQGLRNDMTNLKLVVGRKMFGRAVADYGGDRVNDYIGGAENRLVSGYGA